MDSKKKTWDSPPFSSKKSSITKNKGHIIYFSQQSLQYEHKTESQSSQVTGLAVALDNKFMFLAQIEAAELGLVVHTLEQTGLVTLESV